MEVSDAKKLKALEAENAKLKKLLAEQMMDVSTLKEMLGIEAGERHAFPSEPADPFEAWCAIAELQAGP